MLISSVFYVKGFFAPSPLKRAHFAWRRGIIWHSHSVSRSIKFSRGVRIYCAKCIHLHPQRNNWSHVYTVA